MGMFWSGATSNGALAAAIGSAVLSFLFRQFWPDLPFMDRVGLYSYCVLLCVCVLTNGQKHSKQ